MLKGSDPFSTLNDPNASGGGPKAYGTYVYEYAAGGNRLNRILFNGQAQETFTYNGSGRITQRAHTTAGTTTYAYDDRGLLIQVTKPGLTVSYTYDALGVRKSKTVNGAITRYLTAPLFGLPRVLAELDTGNNVQATYVYGGPQQIKEEPAPADRSRDLYLLHDGLVGSITHALDMTGNLRNQYEYDAFGLRTPLATAANGSSKHYGYTGEETDEETGLIYLRARYYDPYLGRFISADPFWGRLEEPASQNRYVYVQNNPLMYTDPSGLDSQCSWCISGETTGEFIKWVNAIPGEVASAAKNPEVLRSYGDQAYSAAFLSMQLGPPGWPATLMYGTTGTVANIAGLLISRDSEPVYQSAIVEGGMYVMEARAPVSSGSMGSLIFQTFFPEILNMAIDGGQQITQGGAMVCR